MQLANYDHNHVVSDAIGQCMVWLLASVFLPFVAYQAVGMTFGCYLDCKKCWLKRHNKKMLDKNRRLRKAPKEVEALADWTMSVSQRDLLGKSGKDTRREAGEDDTEK